MSGASKVDAWIKKIEGIPVQIPKKAAQAVAKAVRGQVRGEVSQGHAPDGSGWAPGVDGQSVLKKAARAISVRAKATIIEIAVHGYHKYHHQGTAQLPARRLLPVGSIPPALSATIKKTLEDWFKTHMESK